MFVVADKYDIVALGDAAKAYFKGATREEVLNNGHLLELIPHVYSTTPESNRGLRDVICWETSSREIIIGKDPVLKSRLAEIISATPQFAGDLRIRLTRREFTMRPLAARQDP